MFSNMLLLLHFLLPSLVISCFDSTGVARSSFSYMLCALIKIKCLSIRMTLSHVRHLCAYERTHTHSQQSKIVSCLMFYAGKSSQFCFSYTCVTTYGFGEIKSIPFPKYTSCIRMSTYFHFHFAIASHFQIDFHLSSSLYLRLRLSFADEIFHAQIVAFSLNH